ncbi:MAG TPA: LLM class flavin-dependent oxidoreductase [Gaiellaceae bacterium]|jgi:5,10-methylenetetrahydromethanopterin reductase
MEVGLGLQSDKGPEEYTSLAQQAEAAGFDVISVFHDLLFQPAIVPLTLIAQATKRVRLGPAALNTRTLHPVELAGQAAALDLVSGGRAYLGLTDGAWLGRLGIDMDGPLGRMTEAAEIVRRLFAADRSGFHGEHFTLAEGAGFGYTPARDRMPLLIGTWKPRMAALAGRIADEVKIGGCANPDMVRLMREWIGNDDVGIVVGAVTVVDEDGDVARAHAQREVEMYLDVVGQNDPTFEGPPTLDRFAFAGTSAEVAAHARRLFDAGAKRVEFGTPQGLTTAGGVELLCDGVLPLLRS